MDASSAGDELIRVPRPAPVEISRGLMKLRGLIYEPEMNAFQPPADCCSVATPGTRWHAGNGWNEGHPWEWVERTGLWGTGSRGPLRAPSRKATE